MEPGIEHSAVRLRHLTYQRTDLKGIMIDPDALERNCPLDNGQIGKSDSSHRLSRFTLGTIDTLPSEICSAVLLELDLQTLTDFRSVNRRAKIIVDSIPQYKEVVASGPNTLRAVLSTGVAQYLSSRSLYNALCAQACGKCGDFGAFLYLLTCSRVCFLCLIEDCQFLPMTTTLAKEAYGLNRRTLSALPTLRSLPGTYSQMQKIWRKRVALVDSEVARQAGIAFHGSSDAMEQYVSKRRAKIIANYENKLRQGPNNLAAKLRKPACPPYANHLDGKGCNPYRFMSAIRVPRLDRITGTVEWGVSCEGCRKGNQFNRVYGRLDWRRMYTDSGYVDHLTECETSQTAWEPLSAYNVAT